MDIQNKDDVRLLIKDALRDLSDSKYKMDNPEAIELLMGTWAVESNGGHFLKQIGGGPALSAWQIEKPTYVDIINRINSQSC
jgi:hypothetical protein